MTALDNLGLMNTPTWMDVISMMSGLNSSMQMPGAAPWGISREPGMPDLFSLLLGPSNPYAGLATPLNGGINGYPSLDEEGISLNDWQLILMFMEALGSTDFTGGAAAQAPGNVPGNVGNPIGQQPQGPEKTTVENGVINFSAQALTAIMNATTQEERIRIIEQEILNLVDNTGNNNGRGNGKKFNNPDQNLKRLGLNLLIGSNIKPGNQKNRLSAELFDKVIADIAGQFNNTAAG